MLLVTVRRDHPWFGLWLMRRQDRRAVSAAKP